MGLMLRLRRLLRLALKVLYCKLQEVILQW